MFHRFVKTGVQDWSIIQEEEEQQQQKTTSL